MNWFPNGSSLSSVLSGNVGTSTYGIKPDNAPSETISGGFGYGTLFAVCGRGDEGYGYGYAIYSGSNAAGSRVFATYDKDAGWNERVSKSDLGANKIVNTTDQKHSISIGYDDTDGLYAIVDLTRIKISST